MDTVAIVRNSRLQEVGERKRPLIKKPLGVVLPGALLSDNQLG